jgi:mannose-6-phosphate isomerase-like protein (cupin superfamily)
VKPDSDAYANEPIQFPALEVVDVSKEGASITDSYRNIVLNRVNSSCVRMAVMQGEYPWHYHPDADELFLVVEGLLKIDLKDGRSFSLGPLQMVTIPAGTIHRTSAAIRTVNLCFETLGTGTVFVEEVNEGGA